MVNRTTNNNLIITIPGTDLDDLSQLQTLFTIHKENSKFSNVNAYKDSYSLIPNEVIDEEDLMRQELNDSDLQEEGVNRDQRLINKERMYLIVASLRKNALKIVLYFNLISVSGLQAKKQRYHKTWEDQTKSEKDSNKTIRSREREERKSF